MSTPTPLTSDADRRLVALACAANRQAVANHYRLVARALDDLRQFATTHAPALTGEPVSAFVPSSGPGSIAWMESVAGVAWQQAEDLSKAAKWIAEEAAEDKQEA